MTARLRAFELPTETVGAFTATPFLLILDGYDGNPLDLDKLRDASGAKAVVIFDCEVDLG